MVEQIITELRSVPAFYVATSDATGKPRNRPFSLVYEFNGKLMFGTNVNKKVYAELAANPYVEICAFYPEKGEWVRIHGEIAWENDHACKCKMFETMPDLLRIYPGGGDNPDVRCFYIKDGTADYYSFATMNTPVRSTKLN